MKPKFTETIRCGETLHVLVAGSESELEKLVAKIERKLVRPNGHAVIHSDGRRVFIVTEIRHPLEWNKPGSKVRGDLVTRTVSADGLIVSEEKGRSVWATI